VGGKIKDRVEEILEGMKDHSTTTIITSALDKFVWKNDSLWYQYFLYLCKTSNQQKVLLELHTFSI
jgi:hypothetical protein